MYNSGIELPQVEFSTIAKSLIPISSYFVGFDLGNLGKLSKMDNSGTITVIERFDAVTSVLGNSPIESSGGLTPTISIPQATGSIPGYLSAADWTAFNNKVSSSTMISTSAPLYGGGDLSTTRTLSILQADSLTDGYLSSTDWITFSNKQNLLIAGTAISIVGSTLTNTAPDQIVVLTAGTGISTSGTYPNFTITNTLVSSGGTVTSVAELTLGTSGTDLSSTVVNGTTTPVITLNVPTASATNRGALSDKDWVAFNGKQDTISLTTTGTGAATLIGTTLNIPTPTTPTNPQKFLTHPADFAGTNYTLTNADNGYSIIVFNGGTAVTITVPSGLTAQLQVGFIQDGTGDITFTPSGTTLNNAIGGYKIKGQYEQTFLEQGSTQSIYYLLGNTKL